MVKWGQNESKGAKQVIEDLSACQKLGNSRGDISVLFSQKMQK